MPIWHSDFTPNRYSILQIKVSSVPLFNKINAVISLIPLCDNLLSESLSYLTKVYLVKAPLFVKRPLTRRKPMVKAYLLGTIPTYSSFWWKPVVQGLGNEGPLSRFYKLNGARVFEAHWWASISLKVGVQARDSLFSINPEDGLKRS